MSKISSLSFTDFIAQYDKVATYILLEGKRKVRRQDEQRLYDLGALVARSTSKTRFRSGNATGADFFFTQGVASVDPSRVPLVVPYGTHRKDTVAFGEMISLDELDISKEKNLVANSVRNPKTSGLVKSYAAGDRTKLGQKGAYIIRDTLKVVGTREVLPIRFGIFYDDLANPKSGGTGHTMLMCEYNQVPYVDQKVWMSWVG